MPTLAPVPVLASSPGTSICATSLRYPLALEIDSPLAIPSVKPDRRVAGGSGTGGSSPARASLAALNDTPCEHGADTQFASHRLRIRFATLVAEYRAARHDA